MTYGQLQDFIKKLSKEQLEKKGAEIVKLYKDALKEINAEMAIVHAGILDGIEPKNYYQEMIKFNRLEKLQKSLSKKYKSLAKGIETITFDSQTQAFTNFYYYKEYSINWVAPYSFAVVPEAAIQISVFKNQDFIKKIIDDDILALVPKYSGTLKSIIAENNIKSFNKVYTTIENSLLTGQSYKNTAKQLTSDFEQNAYNSLRVVRTEGHRNLESAAFTNWQDAKEKGVKGIRQILSTIDGRERKQSVIVNRRKDDGKGFLYPDGNRYFIAGNTGKKAWDINDRETTIEIVNGVSPLVTRGKNPATGKDEVINFDDFDDWAEDNGLKKDKSGTLQSKKKAVKPVAKKKTKPAPAKEIKKAKDASKEIEAAEKKIAELEAQIKKEKNTTKSIVKKYGLNENDFL